MSGRRRWMFLMLAPLLYGCATTGVVRLETGTRPLVEYAPPSDPKVVAVGQRELLETVASLTLDARLRMNLEAELGRRTPAGNAVQTARWDRGDTDGAWGRVTLLGTASPVDARRRFTLVGAASLLDDEERLNMAMSFALDAVWDGVAQAVAATIDPTALRDLVSAALCTYMLLVVLPEPVTKFIAIALTAYLVAYVGVGPLWNMVAAYKQLRLASSRASTLADLRDAGHRFGEVVGDNGTRVLVMVVLAAAGGKAGMSVNGPKLPGYTQALVAAGRNANLRLASVAEGGVQSVSVRPGLLILGAAPSAVATMAWGPGGGGGLKPQGQLTGRPSRPEPNDSAEKVRSLERENESAQTLANHGYDVEQNPPGPANNRTNPDYRISGEYYDCYAPSTDNSRNIAFEIQKKVRKGQAKKIVLNLDDSKVSIEVMRKQLVDWPIGGLSEVLVVKANRVIHLYP